MLHVTDSAVSLMKVVVLHEDEPGERVSAAAVRLQPAVPQDGDQTISLRPVDGPEPGDAPTEATDLDVFVAPELAGPLDSAILDVEPTPQGPDLVLRRQPDTD